MWWGLNISLCAPQLHDAVIVNRIDQRERERERWTSISFFQSLMSKHPHKISTDNFQENSWFMESCEWSSRNEFIRLQMFISISNDCWNISYATPAACFLRLIQANKKGHTFHLPFELSYISPLRCLTLKFQERIFVQVSTDI